MTDLSHDNALPSATVRRSFNRRSLVPTALSDEEAEMLAKLSVKLAQDGASEAAIKAGQKILVAHHYDLGKYGPQKDGVDGDAGPMTRHALKTALAPVANSLSADFKGVLDKAAPKVTAIQLGDDGTSSPPSLTLGQSRSLSIIAGILDATNNISGMSDTDKKEFTNSIIFDAGDMILQMPDGVLSQADKTAYKNYVTELKKGGDTRHLPVPSLHWNQQLLHQAQTAFPQSFNEGRQTVEKMLSLFGGMAEMTADRALGNNDAATRRGAERMLGGQGPKQGM